MKNYKTLKDLTTDLKSGLLIKTEMFMFQDVECSWSEDCDFKELRCDPINDKQFKVFKKLQYNLQPEINVDLS